MSIISGITAQTEDSFGKDQCRGTFTPIIESEKLF